MSAGSGIKVQSSSSRRQLPILPTTIAFIVAGTSGPLVSGVPSSAEVCLDDQYADTSAGNVVDIYGCNGSGAQEWTANADGTLETLGNCLDVSGK